ncbi:MAG TPA: hypothetical protein PKD09_05160 [Aggregatilinea sp.]|uniref:hypothetical protein n=1 Tax=Aggregatilinea sp. TaxID=2806333 RepID=UPI002CA108E4|nr:hypothetical protein [Aggregatilinea sp.]HML21015.1 hypothetical protein [Aggregatilinea sp.]
MAPNRKYRSSRYAVLLPAGCSPDEATALEQLCHETVARLRGEVVEVFAENDIKPLMDSVQAGAVGVIIYPPYESLVHDPCVTGIVRGGFRLMLGMKLCCAGEPDTRAVPPVLIQAILDVMESCERTYYARSRYREAMPLPFGYRWNGTEIEIVPDQAEQVRHIFQDAVAEQ